MVSIGPETMTETEIDRRLREQGKRLMERIERARERSRAPSFEIIIDSPEFNQQLSEALKLEGVRGLIAEPGTLWISYMDGKAKQIVSPEMFENHGVLICEIVLDYSERDIVKASGLFDPHFLE